MFTFRRQGCHPSEYCIAIPLAESIEYCIKYVLSKTLVRVAHFDGTELKTSPTGGGGMLKRLEIWPLQGGNIDEMD